MLPTSCSFFLNPAMNVDAFFSLFLFTDMVAYPSLSSVPAYNLEIILYQYKKKKSPSVFPLPSFRMPLHGISLYGWTPLDLTNASHSSGFCCNKEPQTNVISHRYKYSITSRSAIAGPKGIHIPNVDRYCQTTSRKAMPIYTSHGASEERLLPGAPGWCRRLSV